MSSVSELSSFSESVLPAWHFQNILGSGKDAMQAFHNNKKGFKTPHYLLYRLNGYFKSLNISLYLIELISVISCIYTA